MKIKDNPYLDQLVRDCETLTNNIDRWVDNNSDLLIEETIRSIKEDIEQAENYT